MPPKSKDASLARELGSRAVEQLADLTALSDVVFTVVSDDNAMKHIFCHGLLKNARGKLFINCATLTPDVHVWVETLAQQAGAQAMEACMASSLTQAREGALYLLCAAQPETFERARPLLQQLSASLRFIGPAGAAATQKQFTRMVAEGLGHLDKSAIAELTFRGRHAPRQES